MGTNYVKKARTVRLPAMSDLQINSFDTGMVRGHGSYVYNGTILKYPDGSFYVTQRPSTAVFNSPADSSIDDSRGRGVYYWAGDSVASLFFVNNDTVYRGTYANPLSQTFGNEGTEKIEIGELGDEIVFVDGQGNEMWYIDNDDTTALKTMNFSAVTESMTFADADPDTITTSSTFDPLMAAGDRFKISDTANNDGTYTVATHSGTLITLVSTDELTAETVSATLTAYGALPQNNNKTLAHGIAVLDQTMYVLATDGTVWGSAIGDPQDWTNALNVITAEKEHDAGVYIDKHYDNIVVLGRRTIEFMYDAGNPTGSPLSTRNDISYNIGCADPNSVWRDGDDIYFLGINTSGQIQPYVLQKFQLTPIANSSIISYLTTTKSADGIETIGAGFSSGGIVYYILTVYNLDGDVNIEPVATYVYNSSSQIWTEWEFAGDTIDKFPLVNYSITDDSRIGEGIMSSGELVFSSDNYVPYDTEQNSNDPYIDTDYVGAGYVLAGADASSSVINMIVRIDNWDNDNRDWKFAHQLRFVGDETANSNKMTIKWNDGNNDPEAYTGTRTIDLQSNLNKLTRLGRFKSRSFEFDYTGTEQIRFKGIDLDITEGTH